MTQVLILPGYLDSGPEHWQSRWQLHHSAWQRVQQADWAQPRADDWVAALDAAVARSGPDTVLAAHSLGCLTVALWAAHHRRPVRGALLVAVPDPNRAGFPSAAQGFADIPLLPLPFPSVVVASTDDPYGGLDHARRCAAAWGSRLDEIGARGHINSDSGLGDWPAGLQLLHGLTGQG